MCQLISRASDLRALRLKLSATTRMAIGQNRPSTAMLVFPNVVRIACVGLTPVNSAHESPGTPLLPHGTRAEPQLGHLH